MIGYQRSIEWHYDRGWRQTVVIDDARSLEAKEKVRLWGYLARWTQFQLLGQLGAPADLEERLDRDRLDVFDRVSYPMFSSTVPPKAGCSRSLKDAYRRFCESDKPAHVRLAPWLQHAPHCAMPMAAENCDCGLNDVLRDLRGEP